MNRMLFVAVVLVAALVIGCQDSNVTGPGSTGLSPASGLSKIAPKYSFLPLEGVVALEGGVTNEAFQVTGLVRYNMSEIVVGGKQAAMNLELLVDAQLKPVGSEDQSFQASGQSMEVVTTVGKDALPIEKEYAIAGLKPAQSLHVLFLVSDASVSVDHMWIAEALPHGRLLE